MTKRTACYVLGLLASLCFGILIGHDDARGQSTPPISDRAVEEVNELWFDVVREDANGVIGLRTFEVDINLAFANERVRLAEKELALAREIQRSAQETQQKNKPPSR